MTFDTAVPLKLKEVQIWFASVITRPIDGQNRMLATSPAGLPMALEAAQHICPSPTLRPEQRLEIYNQQYWWRLLSALHESFPLVTRLFGYSDFNQTIGFPYLVAHPPHHWSLNELGRLLPQWLECTYEAPDKQLVCDAARLDWAYNESFVAPQLESLSHNEQHHAQVIQELFVAPLQLQPAVHLLHFAYDLYSYRSDFLNQEPEYWLDNPFPPLPKRPLWSVLYRTAEQHIQWQELSPGEFQLLKRFEAGTSLEESCTWLEEQPPEIAQEAAEQLHLWLQKWIAHQWLARKG